ncbi:sensor histidine kinase [Roseiconus lacunae]|uniref:histidine kinase n=1 Tax=Roseiconus lacunae TaxID=2605694 RepID=A0ABT7PQV4_9BACT|nr:HAMP domain-containing sensor histidine kinase [Roseiconus lacunae]MDM4018885.1 HAMP domain-containing sensor histidine kinase [Roseiconus lacunae]
MSSNIPMSSHPMGSHPIATATQTVQRQARRQSEPAEPTHLSELDQSEAFETLTRLISETAHDLRAPLTTIREAVRLVRDGDLGRLSKSQQECLTAAIDQCNCAGQMVEEMVQSRRFETGFGNVRRTWVSIDAIREQVESTLQPWALPRNINLLWDGPFGEDVLIYADPALLRRLLVNLANNAIRVTSPQQAVMIRAQRHFNSQMMNWSVVDQGRGITPHDLELISAGKAPTQSIGGLGLLISRQLAAAHFSKLRIESRVGTGTATSFHTPMGGPAGVVANFALWRTQLAQPKSVSAAEPDEMVYEVAPIQPQTSNRGSKRTSRPESIAAPRRVRIDVPSQAVDLGVANVAPIFPHHLYLTSIEVGAAVANTAISDFDYLLQRSMRVTEMAYRTSQRSWVIAFDADSTTGPSRRHEIERTVQMELESLRIRWGNESVIGSVLSEEFATKLSSMMTDMIVRQSLFHAQQSFSDPNTDFDGRPVEIESTIPASRLDRELSNLRGRWQ